MYETINTMQVGTAIYGRCSVRAYRPEQVELPALHALLAAAVRAPTAMHGEPWQFVVVQDRARLQRISDLAKAAIAVESSRLHPDHKTLGIFSQPGFNVFYDASTLVVICAATTSHFEPADCWLAAQNLMLAAHAMGLGTCVIGSAVAALNTSDMKSELGIPVEMTAIAPIIVGKPRGETMPSPRKQPQVLAWR